MAGAVHGGQGPDTVSVALERGDAAARGGVPYLDGLVSGAAGKPGAVHGGQGPDTVSVALERGDAAARGGVPYLDGHVVGDDLAIPRRSCLYM